MTTMTPPTTQSNTDLVRWAFEVLNTHDVTALKPFWNDDTFESFPGQTCRGADEIEAYFNAVFAAMPDFDIQPMTVTGTEDDVFVHWRMNGTHTGAAFEGVEATGRRISLEGMDHFVIRDRTVISNTVVYDQMEFARQSGLLPASGTPGDRATKAAFNLKTRLARRLQERRG